MAGGEAKNRSQPATRQGEHQRDRDKESAARTPGAARRPGHYADVRRRGSLRDGDGPRRQGIERRGQLARGGEAILGALREAGGDHALEPRRDPGPQRREWNGLVADHGRQRLDGCRTVESASGRSASRRRSGRRRTGRSGSPPADPWPARGTCSRPFPGSSPRASPRPKVSPACRPARARPSCRPARGLARQAEVQDLAAAVRGDHDVRRLEVAVDDPLGVRRGEAIGDLPGDLQRLADRHGPRAERVPERLAFHPLHRDPRDALGIAHVVDRDDRQGGSGPTPPGPRARSAGAAADPRRASGR